MRRTPRASMILAGTLALGFVWAAPSVALAGDDGSCTTVANTSSKVWAETPGVVKEAISSSGPFGATAIKAAQLIDKGVQIWNKLANDKSWAKIGPRRLDFGEWNQGTLIGPTERMFISGIPAVNPVQIDFRKTDFDGKVKVVVCKVPETGKPKAVKTFTVEAGAKKGLIKSLQLPAAKGNIITVVLHGKSVGKKLGYKVRAKFLYEDDSSTTVSAPRTQPTRSVSASR